MQESGQGRREYGTYINTLMKDDAGDWVNDNLYQGTVFGSELSRDSIISVTFTDTLAAMSDTAWDVSWNQDGTVMAWTEVSETDEELLNLFIAAEGCIKGTDCGYLFAGYYNAERINFNDCFDTGAVTTMENMFTRCSNLKELDVSSFETGNVTDMYAMFYECENLTELDVSGFKTGNVTDMSHMFRECRSLTKLDVSNFETGNVTNMSSMFTDCGITAEEAGLITKSTSFKLS